MSVPKRSTLINALKKRSRSRAGPTETDAVLAEMNNGSDRANALVWGALVEDSLKEAIASLMKHLTEPEIDDFFGESGPGTTFADKIKLGYALGVYPRATRDDLHAIREIRNAFAHSQICLRFVDADIAAVCDLFRVTLDIHEPLNQLARGSTIFEAVCSRYVGEFLCFKRDAPAAAIALNTSSTTKALSS